MTTKSDSRQNEKKKKRIKEKGETHKRVEQTRQFSVIASRYNVDTKRLMYGGVFACTIFDRCLFMNLF